MSGEKIIQGLREASAFAAANKPDVSNHYVMVMRDDRYWLVGPFSSQEAAAEWGRNPANNPDDDPRWQTIQLAAPAAPPRIITPTKDAA